MTKHIKPLRATGLSVELRDRIKEARNRRKWSQQELGIRIGLPQPHISAIESGLVAPRWGTLTDLLRILDLDLLLIPRSLIPAVQSLIRAHRQPESEERALYAIDEDSKAEDRGDEL